MIVLSGVVKFALYDLRSVSSQDTGEVVESIVVDAARNPQTIVIPAGVAHGWKNIGQTTSRVLNVKTMEYHGGWDEWRRAAHAGPAAWQGYFWGAMVDG